MRKVAYLFFVLMLCGNLITAQTDTIPQLIERLEATSDNKAAITTIGQLLTNKALNEASRLALQTTLIHKYQELQQWDICLNYCQQQVTEAHAQNSSFAEATFYKMIGNTYYHIPDKDKAIAYWKKCIAISEPARFNLLLEQCYHNLGSVYLERSEHYDWAEKYLQQSVKLSIANKTDEQALGRLHYRLLATLYERTNQLDKALKAYADVIAKSRQLKDSSNLAEALMFSSDVLVKQKKFTEALQVSSEALAIARTVAKLDMVRTALDFHAMNLYAAGKYKESYEVKTEAANIIITRYNNDLNNKLSEAEAKFKTAEAAHEQQLALVKERKEKQLYILGLIGLFLVAALLFYNFYQKRSARQKNQMQQQLQEEKERLSRDLHDNLGSQMALLSNNIENLDSNFKKQQPVDDNIEKIKGTSKQLLQTLRETIWILNKEQVTAQEFFDKLVDYTHRYLQSYPDIQLQIKEDFSLQKTLNSNEALQLFRICQEAISNACKYSKSTSLLLQGNSQQTFFEIIIRDFGKGFAIAQIHEEGHYGLKNMQQRATAINATLVINTAANEGVTVAIKI
ncbi:tetratricopeptide repeat-containing sensor histidine kinase [Ferruginibacter sp. SUN106]|uniref:tetratricopeptide repeat-containing sensor histidine kinase n=1 Tax=Ferruginibacter sp. SUN106 TaxID=2978348 RepID=UPI003D368A39